MEGFFLVVLKIGGVIPIFKSGKKQTTTYRPITTLPILAKNFEKLAHINRFNLLEYNQWAEHKTGDVFCGVSDKSYDAINQNIDSLTNFLDFSKAIDTFDHGNLLKKKMYH